MVNRPDPFCERIGRTTGIEELLWYAARKHGRRIAISFGTEELNYSDLESLVLRSGAGLRSLGVCRGSKVALMMPNHPAYLVFFFACVSLGAIVVNLNPLYDTVRQASQIADCGVEILVTVDTPDLRERGLSLLAAGGLRFVVLCSDDGSDLRGRASCSSKEDGALVSAGALYAHAPSSKGVNARSGVALLQFTGGTTGTLKAAALTHGNLLTNIGQLRAPLPMLQEGEEVILGAAPFFHIVGTTVIIVLGAALAAEVAVLPRFTSDSAAELMTRRGVTLFVGVPTMCTALNNSTDVRPNRVEWAKNFRAAIVGGSSLPHPVRSGFQTRTGVRLQLAYGLTETSPVVACMPPFGEQPVGSVGFPLPNTEIEIRKPGEGGAPVPPNELGEVWVSGPQVMQGYWQRPQENGAAFDGSFLRTGDIGYLDKDGYLFLVDRLKDVIICGGYNVYPAQVEEALCYHPAIREAVVIGVPDSYRGESVKAIVSLRDGTRGLDLDALTAFLRDKLSPVEIPKSMEVVNEIPKTEVGKISRAMLRNQASSLIDGVPTRTTLDEAAQGR